MTRPHANTPPTPPPPRSRRLLRGLALLSIGLLLASAIVGWLLQPQRAGPFLLRQVGSALGLELRADAVDYRLRGTPQLVLQGLDARLPGDPKPVLQARRAFVSLPWRTLRSRGGDLTVQRVELDGPVLDLPALQRWLATRPPGGEARIPVLADGLRIRDGRIDNDDWRIDGLSIDLPSLHPERMLRARVRGRYLDPPLSVPADVAIALAHPRRALAGQATGLAAIGGLTVAGDDWRVPAQVFLVGPLRVGKDSALLKPARVGIAGRYRSQGSDLGFRLGLHGPMAFNNATWRLVPLQLVLDGDDSIPDARARGSLSFGRRLRMHLDGNLAAWPGAWPALPPPLSESRSPLPFALDYAGAFDFDAPTRLGLRRDATRFDARFRLPEVLAWLEADATGSPLPPLAGTLSSPSLELAGATLEGVEITLSDPDLPADDR